MADAGAVDMGGGDDRACRIQLPRDRTLGAHNKAECTNPRVFSGTCRVCSKEGHSARECPDRPAVVCRNCKEEGHITSECKNNKVFDTDNVATLPAEEAWEEVVKTAKEAVETRDLDDFRNAIKVYHKAIGELSYDELERSFRANNIEIYIIATEPMAGELLDTHTLINLAGKRDCKFKVGYFFKKSPRTAKMVAVWPTSDEENLSRLKDAGVPHERGIPKCLRCKVSTQHLKSACENIDKTKGNLGIPSLSAPNPVPPKASSANAVNKWVTSPKIVRTQAVGRVAVIAVGHTSKKCPQNNGDDDAEADGYDTGADDINTAAAGGWEDSAGPEVAAGAAPGSGWEDANPAPKQSMSGWGAERTVAAGGW
ncbi:MAG: hypothetical protein Q9201_002403 [Fulgogasparrea decipioides]